MTAVVLPNARTTGLPRLEADPACTGQIQLCGVVVVPVRHAQPDGPTLKLPVQVTRRVNRDNPPSPVVYIQGGPGGKLNPRARMAAGPTGTNHDVVFYEQRGIGASQPVLDCPERDQQRTTDAAQSAGDDARLEHSHNSLIACRNRLVAAGVDLAAFNTAESAADLDDIRVALGYEQLSLVGISYGTYLAQATMRAHPSSIRSVVLDSVVPLDRPAIVPIPSSNTDHALERTFEVCAADPACNNTYPDLANTFGRVAGKLTQQPLMVPLNQQFGGPVPLNARLFSTVLFRELYAGPAGVPRLISAADRGDTRPFTDRLASFLQFNRSNSEGMELSVICHTLGDVPDTDLTVRGQGPLTALSGLPNRWQSTCGEWPHQPFDPAFRTLVQSDIPTLIIAGELDPVTPPANGQRVKDQLSRSTFLEVPREGHTPGIRTSCGQDVIAGFLDNPAAPLNDGCVKNMRVSFALSPS